MSETAKILEKWGPLLQSLATGDGGDLPACTLTRSEVEALQRAIGDDEREIANLRSALGNAFVDGAKWWEYTRSGGWTMWQSDQQAAAEEAARRGMPFRPSLEGYLERQIADRDAEIARLKADGKSMTDQLLDRIGRGNDDLLAAETEIARLKAQVDELTRERDEAISASDLWRQERAEAFAATAEATRQAEEMTDARNERQEEVERLEIMVDRLIRERDEARAELARVADPATSS